MTKQEIEALIDAKIAGQGSAIDAGSALPAILKGILELASEGGSPSPVAPEPKITIRAREIENLSMEDAIQEMGLTEEEFLDIPKQSVIRTTDGVFLTRVYYSKGVVEGDDFIVVFGGMLPDDTGTVYRISLSDNRVNAKIFEL